MNKKDNISFISHGFSIYRHLPIFEEPIVEDTPKSDVKSPAEVMFDKIFCKDINGWPNSSLSVMLSEKTSDDVRKFIEQNLMFDVSQSHAINDENVVSQFSKLNSEFIAEASRNRYESIEDYEKRLQSIIERDDNDSIKHRAEELRKKFFEKYNK